MELETFVTNELFKISGHPVQIWSAVLALSIFVVTVVCLPRFQKWLDHRFSGENETNGRFIKVASYLIYFLAALLIVNILGLYGLIKAELWDIHKETTALLDLKLFAIGKTSMTLWTCVYVFALAWFLIRATEQLSGMISGRLLSKTKLDRGIVEMCAASTRYCVMALGIALILQSAGIDLSALSFVAGAAGIAIGLGLQALMNNVVSGFVILVDRPIKLGDRIDIGGVNGEVTHISLRATTLVTNDNIAVIVPNSQFISTQVVNWTYTTKQCRFQFPIITARDASPSLIERLLIEVGQEHPGVLKSPPPEACFDEIGEKTLKFSLSVWTEEYVGKPNKLRSDINYAIAKKFSEKGLGLDGVADTKSADTKSADAKSSDLLQKGPSQEKTLPSQAKSAAFTSL
jgi:small-conductance mechanosensitive channel